jgi:hypothetical protein
MEFRVEKKISLVDSEVKEPCDPSLKLPPSSSQNEGDCRSRILEEVKAMKERARKAKTSTATNGTFRSKGIQSQASNISEGNESSTSLTHSSTPEQLEEFVTENAESRQEKTLAQGSFIVSGNVKEELVQTPLHSLIPYPLAINSQSTLSDSSKIHNSTDVFNLSDISLSLPELKEVSTIGEEKSWSLSNCNPSPSSNLPYVKEIFRGGRNVVHLPGIGSFQDSNENLHDQSPDQTPIQGRHVRRFSDGSSFSMLSRNSTNIQALKDRARRARNFLVQPGAFAEDDSPFQLFGKNRNAKNNSDESPQSMLHFISADTITLKERARRIRGSLVLPGAYPMASTTKDCDDRTSKSHMRNKSAGSTPYLASNTLDIKALKERARRGRASITLTEALSFRDDEVNLGYAPSHDTTHMKQFQNTTFQTGLSPHLGDSPSSNINSQFNGTQMLIQNSVGVSPYFEIQILADEPSTPSGLIDIQSIKNRARRGRNSVTANEAEFSVIENGKTAVENLDDATSNFRSTTDIFIRDDTYASDGSQQHVIPAPPKSSSESDWVDPFMGLMDRQPSHRVPTSVAAPRDAYQSNVLNAPVQHQSVWEMEQQDKIKALSSACKVERSFCLIVIGVLLVVLGSIGVIIGIHNMGTTVAPPPKRNDGHLSLFSRECFEAYDHQSTRYKQISDLLGGSERNTTRRAAMCWLADADIPQVDTVDPVRVSQRFSLATFYFSTLSNEVSRSSMENWLNEENECQWSGIECDEGVVSKMGLNNSGLEGTIPSEIALLTKLKQLNLMDNMMLGSLPESIFNLSALEMLILENNQFNGTISSLIGNLKRLKIISFSSNRLTGTIPKKLTKLKNIGEFGNYSFQ